MKELTWPSDAELARLYPVVTQTTKSDRIVLIMLRELAKQIVATANPISRRLRRAGGKLAYLELGSYLGGTLAQYLLDEQVGSVVSVDKRVTRQWDERNSYFEYDGVTTQLMLDRLHAATGPNCVSKLICFDGGSREFAASAEARRHIGRVDVVMIDAEHTHSAVFHDFVNLLPFLRRDGFVLFHDAQIIFQGLQNIIRFLEYKNASFTTKNLKDHVYAIGFNRAGAALAATDFGKLEWDETAFVEQSRRFIIEQTIRLNIDEAKRIVAE